MMEFKLSCAAWKIQKKRGSRKRRRYALEDKETADTTQEEEIDCVKNSEDNNKDSSMTDSLKVSIHHISGGDGGSIDAAIPARKSIRESEKSSSTLKRRRYNPEDEETVHTTQEEEVDYAKNSEDNNKDSSMTESLKHTIHQISRGNASSTDATILAEKSTEESEKSSSTDECVSSSNPRKMLDFDLNELPPLEDEE